MTKFSWAMPDIPDPEAEAPSTPTEERILDRETALEQARAGTTGSISVGSFLEWWDANPAERVLTRKGPWVKVLEDDLRFEVPGACHPPPRKGRYRYVGMVNRWAVWIASTSDVVTLVSLDGEMDRTIAPILNTATGVRMTSLTQESIRRWLRDIKQPQDTGGTLARVYSVLENIGEVRRNEQFVHVLPTTRVPSDAEFLAHASNYDAYPNGNYVWDAWVDVNTKTVHGVGFQRSHDILNGEVDLPVYLSWSFDRVKRWRGMEAYKGTLHATDTLEMVIAKVLPDEGKS